MAPVGAPPVRGKGWSPPTQSSDITTQPLFGPTWRTRVTSKGGRMSTTNSGPQPGGPNAAVARALPAAPSLEYERKEAKALLDQIRRRDREGLRRVERVHAAALGDRSTEELRLADAQPVIARE